jgi:cell division protein FtsN
VSNNDFPDDDYYDGDEDQGMSKGKIIGAVLALLIVTGFGVGIWYAYDQGVKKGVQLAPPIISADTSPVKEKPEEPGGMDIPHQDKQVFSVLKSGEGAEKVEKLMPPLEESTEDAQPEKEVAAGKSENEGTADDAPAEKLIEKATETAPEKPAVVVAPVPDKKPTEELVAKSPEPVVKTPVVSTSGTRYRVQLGSFRNKEAAEKQWTTLKGKFASLLGDVSYRVQDIDVKDKGTFHRLQAGAYENRSNAISLCESLKAQKQDCLVVSK